MFQNRGTERRYQPPKPEPEALNIKPKTLSAKTETFSAKTETDDDGSSLSYEAVRPGMTVQHSRFGVGKVLAIDGSGASAKATINFGSIGQKQLIIKFAKLKVVSSF